jgi:hypothetical protein
MQTQCSGQAFLFPGENSRQIVAKFDGGAISSDAGGLLLRQVERATGILSRFAGCFTDHRDPDLIEHTVDELVSQRGYALALGYEDLNDHDDLRHDPLLAVLVGKRQPTGRDRLRKRDRGKALAGKSTLNRLELTPVGANATSRYKKIVLNTHQAERVFTDLFVQSHRQPPKEIILDLDATDDPVHGGQLGRFFHGYYQNYCYLPLYIFCGEHLLWAQLRPSDIDASAGSVKALAKIIGRIRQSWPEVKILIRGDSGFCREPLMAWCEGNDVDYLLGLAQNERLKRQLAEAMAQAKSRYQQTHEAARVFKEFTYQTLTSWSRQRRVIGKAEYLAKGENPRFVVTCLPKDALDARTVYEDLYCARGAMENRIKEQQLYLFADRTSAATMRANQLRLWFSSLAYTLLAALRRLGLQGTELAHAQCSTIRLKLLKIGAAIRVTVRKVWISLAESYPYQQIFQQVYDHLMRLTPLPLRC